MTKTTIFSIIGVVALVAAAGIVIAVRNNPNKTPSDVPVDQTVVTTTDESSEPMQTNGKKMAFSQFVKQGGSYECTVKQYIDAGMVQATEGKVFINGEKLRGDFTTSVQGMNVKSSLIVRDGFAYAWTSMTSTGYKLPVSIDDSGNVKAGTSGSYAWNAEQIGDYDCKPWTANESQFTIPTSITFKTM